MIVLVMIDGLRPDALAKINCPNLKSVQARGSSTLNARSVMPSITLPCHMSMFHSVPPTRHGITTNTHTPMARPLPGLIEVLHAAGKKCAFIHNWEPLRNLNQPEKLALSFFRDNGQSFDGDQKNTEEAVRFLPEIGADFAFVYLGSVDIAGHVFGWMADGYLEAAERADTALGVLLNGLPGNTTFIIHADHGGHDRNHGEDIPEDMTIPWMAVGPNIRQNYTIQAPVSLLSDAPTIARMLGVTPDPQWEGEVVAEIFV